MSHWIHGLTGNNDRWRCVSRAGCDTSKYVRPSFHLVCAEDRSLEVVSEQWHVAILTFAIWAVTTHKKGIVFYSGEAHVSCPMCKTILPLFCGDTWTSGILYCYHTDQCRRQADPIYVLHSIAKSAFDDALNAARTACGGVRGYPLLRGMSSRLPLPVLHCTGNLAKVMCHFPKACLPAVLQERARVTLLAITGKSDKDAIYLREFRELVAHGAARPENFSRDLDPVFVILLQLCQLINAAWRASLADSTARERDGAAAITRLAASIMGPLYQEVKPLDPDTKDAKVLSLYLHAPIAHLHHQVGSKRAPVAYVSDDVMEGHIRGVGRYTYNHGNNASQAALLSDLAGLSDATIKFSTPRSHPSSLIFTKYVRVCGCWTTLGMLGGDDYDALATIAEETPELAVERRIGGEELLFTLPLHDRVEKNKERPMDAAGNPLRGKKESLLRRLRRRQQDIVACHCGRLTGKRTSAVMDLARQRQSAARGRPAVEVPAAFPINSGAGGSCPSSPERGTQPSAGPSGEGDSSAGSADDPPVRGSGAGAGHATGRAKSVTIRPSSRAPSPLCGSCAASVPCWQRTRLFSL